MHCLSRAVPKLEMLLGLQDLFYLSHELEILNMRILSNFQSQATAARYTRNTSCRIYWHIFSLLCFSPSALWEENKEKCIFFKLFISSFGNNICRLWKSLLFWSTGFPTSGDGTFYKNDQRRQPGLQENEQWAPPFRAPLPASGSLFHQPRPGLLRSRDVCSEWSALSPLSYVSWTLLVRVETQTGFPLWN